MQESRQGPATLPHTSSAEHPDRAPEGGAAPHRFEDYPLTRQEYINVMVHFYRGEVHRSTAWRQRLDATTNWSVLTTAAMLSFTFASKENSHIILLLSTLIILAYLSIEARRYRYFEVYRARVRMLEENFLIPVVTRQLESPMGSWREMVAMDLDLPKYKTSFLEAMGFRLRRNYMFIFLIVLGGWFVKLTMHPEFFHSWSELWKRMAVGVFPSWVVLGGCLLFYAGLLSLMWYARHSSGGVPEDEIAGIERNLEHWKF
jgi:uncharacterized membrane protein